MNWSKQQDVQRATEIEVAEFRNPLADDSSLFYSIGQNNKANSVEPYWNACFLTSYFLRGIARQVVVGDLDYDDSTCLALKLAEVGSRTTDITLWRHPIWLIVVSKSSVRKLGACFYDLCISNDAINGAMKVVICVRHQHAGQSGAATKFRLKLVWGMC